MTTTFIGGGNMATALIGGMIARGTPASAFRVVEPDAAQRAKICARYAGLAAHAAIDADALAGAALVVLAVKPQNLRRVALDLAPHLGAAPVVLSIAAGVRLADLSRWLGGYRRLVRAMPNTPALIGQGISGVHALPEVDAHGLALATNVLDAAGAVVHCADESMLDAVTGVSGSGPAYVFYFIEALEQAASDMGFDRADARKLAYSTFSGAIALAQASGDDPATLRAQVTSKRGTTERAIASMEAASVKAHIIAAAKAAAERAREMGDVLGNDDGPGLQ